MSKAALLTALNAALHIRITRYLTSRYLRCKLRCTPLVGRAEFVPLVAAIFFVLLFVLLVVLFFVLHSATMRCLYVR